MSTARQRWTGLLRSIFVARPKQKIVDWAAAKIRLSTSESGDFPGRYDPTLNPLPSILWDAYESGLYDEAIIKKSSQSGFTLAVIIFLTWFCHFGRRNWMYVLDSREEMRKVSETRLRPMIERTGGAHIQVAEDDEAKAKGFTNLFYKFRGFAGYLSGARSVGALANKSVAVGVCDEADAYNLDNAPKESHPVHLVRERVKKQNKSFFILLSKPANEEDITHQEYLTGTRHKCFVPCPFCSQMQELVWEQVKFGHCRDLVGAFDLERVMRETYYECINPECRGHIQEHHKPAMVARREWRRTNFGQDKHKAMPRKFSCEVTDLYSTFPKASWAALAVEWIDAQGNLDKLKRFLRGRLARAWVERVRQVKESDVERCIGEHDHGHCPEAPDIVTLCSDRQSDVFKWVKCGFRRGVVDTCWVIDYGESGTWGDLMRHADEPVVVDHWGAVPAEMRLAPVVLTGLIDEGYKTFQIRQHCLTTAHEVEGLDGPESALRFFPAKGRGGLQIRDMVWMAADVTQDGQPVSVYHFSDDDFRSILYEEAIANRSDVLTARAEVRPALAPLLVLCANPDTGFISELCQERRQPRIVRGKLVQSWMEPKGANDFGDALKLCLVTWYRLRSLVAAVPQEGAGGPGPDSG